ncbi:MAG: TcpD family membrane protein [Clostridium sp.]|uniref:TcpD family membrane protein n=1 Tax=Clostridium sp. TaxID=1506 RepID=UPI003F32DB9F
MNKLREMKKRVLNKLKENKKKIEIGVVTLASTLSVNTIAFADISGETIKNNVVNKFISPIFIIVLLVFLVKEYTKKNYAQLIIAVVFGAFVYAFILEPQLAKTVVSTVKSILGV